jgi:hypothetical protein
VDALDHLPLAIGLEALDLGAELLAERDRLGIDLGERDRSVLGRDRAYRTC